MHLIYKDGNRKRFLDKTLLTTSNPYNKVKTEMAHQSILGAGTTDSPTLIIARDDGQSRFRLETRVNPYLEFSLVVYVTDQASALEGARRAWALRAALEEAMEVIIGPQHGNGMKRGSQENLEWIDFQQDGRNLHVRGAGINLTTCVYLVPLLIKAYLAEHGP